jgi:outer membrane biogenesis lipoprotein LolB
MTDTLSRTTLKIFLVFSLLLSFCAGCAHRPVFDLGLGPVRGPDDIVERINGNASRLHTLRAEAHIRSPHVPQSRMARASVLFSRPSRYRVKFSAPFGMTVAMLTIQQGQVHIYMPLANRLYEEQFTPQRMGHLLGFDMSLADLMEAIVGTVRLPPVSELLDNRAVQDGYVLSFKWHGGRQEVHVASDGFRVYKVEFFDGLDQTFLVKTFHDYRVVDGIVRPNEVRLALPTRGEELKVLFTRQEVNHEIREEEFLLDLPDSVERLPLQF